MSNSLSIATAIEKSKVASTTPFVALAEIQLMNTPTQQFVDTVFVANNDEEIVYQGETYVAFPFNLNLKQEAGATPEITLTATDLNRVLATKLEQYGGASGSLVIMRIVNTANLAQAAELEEIFEVLETAEANYQITAKMGIESALRRTFPRRTQMRDRCSWRYRSAECGYTGPMPTCDLSLQGPNGCAAHANAINFGGYPGLISRGVRLGR